MARRCSSSLGTARMSAFCRFLLIEPQAKPARKGIESTVRCFSSSTITRPGSLSPPPVRSSCAIGSVLAGTGQYPLGPREHNGNNGQAARTCGALWVTRARTKRRRLESRHCAAVSSSADLRHGHFQRPHQKTRLRACRRSKLQSNARRP
jgi:hypothetical protein